MSRLARNSSVRRHIDETGVDRTYYHGKISREEAVKRLTERDGSFILRMSETQEGVYTLSVMQRSIVRHIRVLQNNGYFLSEGDVPESSIWLLMEREVNRPLSNQFDVADRVILSNPLKCPETAIAPDLFESAGEAGIDTSEFGDDVTAFLQGGDLARRRSMKSPAGRTKSSSEDQVREGLSKMGVSQAEDPDLERFMNGAITAQELQRRREAKLNVSNAVDCHLTQFS